MIQTCTTSTEAQLAFLGDLMVMLETTASSSGQSKALTDATTWVERVITNSPSGSIRRSVVRETVAGYGSQRLVLSRTPLRKIARMFDATDTCEATEYCSTDFRIDDADAGFVTLTGDAGFAWNTLWQQGITRFPSPPRVVRPWLVEYEAGWVLNETSSTCAAWVSTSTGRTLPEDVERAILLKAASFYQGTAGTMQSMKVGPLSINYGSNDVDPIRELLAPFRRVF